MRTSIIFDKLLNNHQFFKFPLILAVVFTFVVGCDNTSDKISHQKKGVELGTKAKSVGYLRIPFDGIVSTIDPGLTFDVASIEVVEQLFLGLTDFEPNSYTVQPELAIKWELGTTNTIYTFYLRKDAKWTDGKPVVASDIVWALRRNILPSTQAPGANTLFVIKNADAINRGEIKDVTQLGVKALDDYTLQFELENPIGYFPALVSLWTYRPLPVHVIEQHPDDWTDPRYIQTNGSYKLASWDKGTKLILEKNPNYYEADKVAIPTIHYYIVPESSLGLAMYENDELDIIGQQYLRIPMTEMPRIKSDPVLRQQIHTSPQFCTEHYQFNTRIPPTDNPLVRKAIAAAIDKRLIVDVVVKDAQMPATTFTRPPIFGSVDPAEKVGIQFNPKQARAWLAEAGYPDGKGIPTIVLMHNVSEIHGEIAKAVKTILKHYLNINIEIKSLDFDRYMDAIEQPNTPNLFRLGWCADYPDANNFLHDAFDPKDSPNWVGWDNQTFSDLVRKAQQISDQEERKRLYKQAEKILTEDSTVVIPLYFATAQYLVKPWVKGWYNMAFGGQQIRYWSLEQ